MLLLPLSIAPVMLLGPSLLRAPVALAHEAWGEARRLERRLQPAATPHQLAPATAQGPSVWVQQVSFGPIYGRWSAFPQAGRTGFEHAAGDAGEAWPR